MPVEAGTTIEDLDSTYPTPDDGMTQGDDHLRLIKAILKAQFPGAGGNGFAEAITVTETELNHLDGLTGNVQAQIDAITAVEDLIAPEGTKMLFAQNIAPNGWTQDTSHDNRMLRLVNTGTGGQVAGSDTPISIDFNHQHITASHALTLAQIPSHTHGQNNRIDNYKVDGGGTNTVHYNAGRGWVNTAVTSPAGSGNPHHHGNTGATTNLDWAPRYMNIIMCIKDAFGES